MIQNAAIYGADSLIFDLEDSIPLTEKDAARNLVRNALFDLDFGKCELTVRINGMETTFFENDLNEIIPAKPDGILLPKTESLSDIKCLDKKITSLEEEHNLTKKKIKIMPIIESAKGVLHMEQIAKGPRVVAIGLGGEDLIADIGIKPIPNNITLDYIKAQLIIACAANKIQAIDTVYINIHNLDGLYQTTKKAIEMGFQGKSVIHPSQIDTVHEAFAPTAEEIEKANRIVNAYKDSIKKGSGAISVDGRMIDLPIVYQAERILQRAKISKKEE
jgi:citrate lyase subunit beta/citryl-CoA lyase